MATESNNVTMGDQVKADDEMATETTPGNAATDDAAVDDTKQASESDSDVSMKDAKDGSESDEDESVDGKAHEDSGNEEASASSSDESDADNETGNEQNDQESANEKSDEDDEEDEDETESEAGDKAVHETSNEAASPEKSNSKCLVCNKSVDDDAHLTCVKCDTTVHETCAKDKELWEEADDAPNWQCQNCSIVSTSESPTDRKKDQAPRLVRDLLPVSRGLQKPNSHSIFNQPLIAEGEDGGRSLRKRKSPTTEPMPEKRRRRATPKASSTADEADAIAPSTRRASMKTGPIARVLQYRPPNKPPPHKFILAFRLDQAKIEKVLSKPPRPGRRRRDRRRPPKIPPPPIYQPPVPKFPALPTSHLIFPSMWGDRENELNAKPYGGILSEADADTSRSLPQLRDRELFEIARKEAEEERRKTSAAAEAEINGELANASKPNRTVSGPPSKIKCIQFGKYVIDTFYAAPYPEEYSHESRLFICEFCLKYLPSEFVAHRHKLKCPVKHPPGDEIYREGSISVWEVDGRKRTEYCQCLCLMAKMFLGSKTLYYDVEPFLFYILTEYDEFGYHFVGYFSKEKRPASQNNVSCILVMPIHQRKGYATFLIDFSYLLTRIEGKDGSPEKPLSDMGLTAYRSYWDLTISRHLLANGMKPISTRDLMQRTGMTADDVIHSLERLYTFVRDPVTRAYALRYDKQLYENIVAEFESKKHRELKPDNLVWTPYIMGRSDQAQLDGQPMQAIAPRDGDDIAVEDPEDLVADTPVAYSADIVDAEPLSPRSHRIAAGDQIIPEDADPLLVNGNGHIAPGPPTTEALTGSSTAMTDETMPHMNGTVTSNSAEAVDSTQETLTGYALVIRNEKIPPSRFQIDPPIPASMLRNRQNRRRTNGRARADGASAAAMPAATRSSPRHGNSVAGSINGGDAVSPEKPSTPIRRSNRKSGLVNMEVASLDALSDAEEDDDDVIVANGSKTINDAKLPDDESTASSSDAEEDIAVESTSEEGEDNAASSEDDEEEEEEDDENGDNESEEEEEEDDDDDDDPEVEIEEDEDEDEDEDEEDD